MTRARFAADPAQSRGREFAEDREGARGPRSEFQRDRDRIVHSIAFRRLRSKTQVFIAPDGDHYRTRLTHSLEVAQLGRTLARALGLDEDLTEALCLAHDIGHPPFGHAGEKALAESMARHGGFDHNAHSLRTVMRLESPYCEHEGLNLTWDVLEGLAKHNGPVSAPNWALTELDAAFPLDLSAWPSLEAQIAAVADDIAYDNHDIDDGLRAGFLSLDDVCELDFLATQWRAVERRFPNAPRDRQLRELVRSQIGLMVNDVLAQTRAATADLASIDEVRAAGRPLAGFSPSLAIEERRLKQFMYRKLYYHPNQLETAERARDVIARLYAAYEQDGSLLPESWRAILPQHDPARARHIADFIAGMTDRFAIEQCAQIYGKTPEGYAMSDPLRIVLAGSTGLIGRAVIVLASRREDLRIAALARHETRLPRGARLEVFIAEPAKWDEVIEALRPVAVICALGTTWNKAGKDEAAFRAVDEELVLAVARAAKTHGARRFVAVSSTGADSTSGNFYLRVKGEVERELARVKFERLDILRPGLLRGHRGADRRLAERIGIAASPVADLLLHGRFRAMRSIAAEQVAEAALALALRKAGGRFVHDNDSILRAARSLPQPAGD